MSVPSFTDTVIVGAGQAGLATAHQLSRHGRDCVVLDGAHRIGDNWRQQYDSLRLFTPNRSNGLPGMAFPGDPWGFPGKDEVADFLEAYAVRFSLPVQLSTRVTHLGRSGDGFAVDTTGGPVACRNVVIATGPFGRSPAVPDWAGELDGSILQLHSSDYRRPGQLPAGPVLVVGGGHSGCDIALELAGSHPTTLAGRDPGQIPIGWDSPLLRIVLPVVLFGHQHLRTRRTPLGRRQRPLVLAHGGPMLRVKRAHLLDAGVVRRTTRAVGVRDGLPLLADGTVVPVASVVWATGYRHDWSWLDLPVLDDHGWPREYRGVSTDVPGVHFCGLAYQYAFSSMTLAGVARDASHVARSIVARPSGRRPAVGAAGAGI